LRGIPKRVTHWSPGFPVSDDSMRARCPLPRTLWIPQSATTLPKKGAEPTPYRQPKLPRSLKALQSLYANSKKSFNRPLESRCRCTAGGVTPPRLHRRLQTINTNVSSSYTDYIRPGKKPSPTVHRTPSPARLKISHGNGNRLFSRPNTHPRRFRGT